jgi:hypothetical protein
MASEEQSSLDLRLAAAAPRIRTCPRCANKPLARILYGLIAPDEKLWAQMEAGRVVLGGCCISGDDPTRACLACDSVIWPNGRAMGWDEWRAG